MRERGWKLADIFETLLPKLATSGALAGLGHLRGQAEVPELILKLQNLQADVESKKALAALHAMQQFQTLQKTQYEPGLAEARTRGLESQTRYRDVMGPAAAQWYKERSATESEMRGPRVERTLSQAGAADALTQIRQKELTEGKKTVSAVVSRILEKMAKGEQLTPGEEAVIGAWQKSQAATTITTTPKGRTKQRRYAGPMAERYNDANLRFRNIIDSIADPGLYDKYIGGVESAHEQAYDMYEQLTDPMEREAAEDAIVDKWGSLEP